MAPRRQRPSEFALLLTALVAGTMMFAVIGPASAQFFDFGWSRPRPAPPPPPRGNFFNPFQQIFPGAPPQRQERPADFSRAPPPEKRDTVAEKNVLVIGDAMADWLAYGLEDAFSEQPDMGVLRRHKTNSGLIRYQPKGEPADWIAAAKAILATEKPDAIVVMLGLNDRIPIREEKIAPKPGDKKPDAGKDAKGTKPDEAGKDGKTDAAKGDGKDAEQSEDQADAEAPAAAAPEKTARGGNSAGNTWEFRDDRWVELYSKKIEDLINVLKSKGVPVVWVGLPAVRGAKATSDMLFLDTLYRDAAGKAGITYVDVWDGFVDEAGRFMPQGPDFEGQIRRLRAADGVYFTKAGARKLAHYVEREIMRLLNSRTTPVALPSEPALPDLAGKPGGPAPRPLAGPVLPLMGPANASGDEQLVGGPGSRAANWDSLAARTLVKGEALPAPAGRADDYAWPRRDVGKYDPARDGVAAAPASLRDERGEPPPEPAPPAAAAAPAAPPPPAKRKPQPQQPAAVAPAPQQPGFFGFGVRPAPVPAQPPAQARPRPRDNAPRPPAAIGRSAAAPEGMTVR